MDYQELKDEISRQTAIEPTRLELRGMQIVDIPLDLIDKNVEYIDLSDNRISIVPVEIERLGKLESLTLDLNLIREIPRLHTLKNLKYLGLGKNRIIALPPSIAKYFNSEFELLNLDDNEISHIPASVYTEVPFGITLFGNHYIQIDEEIDWQKLMVPIDRRFS
jgi:Leucine-rich repeat (LRR) protein